MKKVYVMLISFFSLFSYSQNLIYSGKINNSKNKDLLINLTNLLDSTVIYTENTFENKFSFNKIKKGNYKRCLISNNYYKCDTISLEHSLTGDIIEMEDIYNLSETIIITKKPFIQNKNGVIKINIENSTILTSGSLFETIAKLPGVSYSYVNDNFKLKGKEGIQIQIDGQTLYISGSELNAYLKSIPSEDIANIEINSTPSAKFDASGNAGIINIITKKTKRQGIYIGSSLNSTQGRFYKQNYGIKGQYSTLKKRFMLYYINSFNTDFEKASTLRNFTNDFSAQETFAKINGNTNTINSQFENKFSNSNLLINSTLSLYNENIDQRTFLDFINKDNISFSKVNSSQNSLNKLKNFDLGINYIIKFKKSQLDIKSNYILYNINNNSYLNSVQTPIINFSNDLINFSPNKINLYITQVDYNQKINSTSNLETGMKYIYQSIDSQNVFYQSSSDSVILDDNKSNSYLYKEHILSSYIQYEKKINDLNLTIGNRIEYNPSIGLTKINDYLLNRKQINYFPFINISYNYSDNDNINLSFSKRINRPRFKNLMPFIYYIDPYTQILGNPNLRSSIINQIEFQYIKNHKYIFSLGYSLTNNSIYQTPYQENTNLSSFFMPINIDKMHSISFSSNLSNEITKWWYFSVNAILYFNKVNSSSDNINIDSFNWSGQFVTTNIFSLPKKIKLEITSDYTTPAIKGPYKTLDLFSLNASVSRSFFENNLRISIIGNDILKTYNVNNYSIIENQNIKINQFFDTHWVRLSIVYKFNKGIKKNSLENDKITDEIKSRTK